MTRVSADALAGVILGVGLGFFAGQRCERRDGSGTSSAFVVCADVAVHIVDSLEQLEVHAARILGSLGTAPMVVVGLDTEWASGKSIAVWQLAFPDACLLIRVHKLGSLQEDAPLALAWPKVFLDVIHHSSVIYAGSGIQQDLTLIREQLGIGLQNFVELQSIARRHGFDAENGVGLQGLTKTLLGRDLSKDNTVRCGNWKADPLTKRQVDYAAADAVVSRELLLNMYARNAAREASDSDFATWLQPFIGGVAKPAKAAVQPAGQATEPVVQKTPRGRALKASRKVTTADTLAKAARVAAAFACAREPYLQVHCETDGHINLTDVRMISDFAIRSSSFAKGLPPQHCVPSGEVLECIQAGLERHWFLGAKDWRAERKAAVTFEGPAVASFDIGSACHWIEIDQPTLVQASCFALRCTASAACHTNAPTQWVLQALSDGESADWETLHICGPPRPTPTQTSLNAVDVGTHATYSPPQVWDYENDSFSNEEIPGETRFFHIENKSGFRRFRWIFFSDANKFSVNLSGLLLFGRRLT